MRIHQDATLRVTDLSKGQTNSLELEQVGMRTCMWRMAQLESVTRHSSRAMRSRSLGRSDLTFTANEREPNPVLRLRVKRGLARTRDAV